MAKSSHARIVERKDDKSSDERFRGSSEVPLTPQGVENAHKLAEKLSKLGPFDEIHTSNLDRTKRTAGFIARATNSPNPKSTDALHPWHLGHFEGKLVTQEAVMELNRLAHEEPDKKIPGRGPKSTANGESFNDFVRRFGKFFYAQIAEIKKNPDKRILDVTHYRDLLLARALVEAGLPEDYKHEADTLFKQKKGNDDLPPGTIQRVSLDGDKPKMEPYGDTKREGGLYFVRHEKTAWNKPSGGAQS